MKTLALAVVLIAMLSPAILCADDQTWENAVFDSAPQAYAFAARVDAPLVIRTNEATPHYVVFIGNPKPRFASVQIGTPREQASDPGTITANQINAAISSVVISSSQNTSLTVTNGSVQVSAGDFMTATHFRSYGGYEDAGGNQVIGAQQPAIADADGSLADLTAKLNRALAVMRAHGLIAK